VADRSEQIGFLLLPLYATRLFLFLPFVPDLLPMALS
jgi:hypothetical protein